MSALPTHPAHGFPVAAPLPLPFMDAEPSRVDLYGLGLDGDPGFAPVPFKSALEYGCGCVKEPLCAPWVCVEDCP